MKTPIADALRLLCYETTMLYRTGAYIEGPAQHPTQRSSPDIYATRSSTKSSCASTVSAESLAPCPPSTTSDSPTLKDPVVQNALLEAFLIHYRLLAEFLCKKKDCHPDTILASDYASLPHYANIIKCQQRCHEWLAHLSSNRLTPNKHEWPIADMYASIITALREFLKQTTGKCDAKAQNYSSKIHKLPISLH